MSKLLMILTAVALMIASFLLPLPDAMWSIALILIGLYIIADNDGRFGFEAILLLFALLAGRLIAAYWFPLGWAWMPFLAGAALLCVFFAFGVLLLGMKMLGVFERD